MNCSRHPTAALALLLALACGGAAPDAIPAPTISAPATAPVERPMPDLGRLRVPPAPEVTQYRDQLKLRTVAIVRGGDVREIRALLDELDDSPRDRFDATWQIAFDPAHIAPEAALPILEDKFRAPGTAGFVRAKVALIAGTLATEGAADFLRWVLAHDADADAIATAIDALRACPPSRASLSALKRLKGDGRESPLKYGWDVTRLDRRARLAFGTLARRIAEAEHIPPSEKAKHPELDWAAPPGP